MARMQRKVMVWIVASGFGVVLAANPSGALPWGASLRPSFVTEALGGAPSHRVDDGDPTSPDPTIAPSTDPAGASGDAGSPGAAPSPAEPAAPAAPPAQTPAARPDGASLLGDQPAHALGDATPEPPTTSAPEPPPTEPPATTEAPRPPEPPTTVAHRDDRTPASLSLQCHLQPGAQRADVACAWSGDSPDGAVRLLVLRGDGTVGRVRLSTDDLGLRSYLDTDAGAARTFSYVVVFLDGNGKTVGHSNGVSLTTPAAPTPPPPTTAGPKPTEPKPPTPPVSEPKPPVPPTTVSPEPQH